MIFFYLLLSLFTIAFVCCFLLNIFFMRKIKQALDFLSFALHSMCIVYNETEMCMISLHMCMAQMYSFFQHGTKTNLLNCLNRSENEDWNAHAQCVHTVYEVNAIANITIRKETGNFVYTKRFTFKGSYREKKLYELLFLLLSYLHFSLFVFHSTNLVYAHKTQTYIHVCLVIYSIPFRNSFDSFCIVLSFLYSLYRRRRRRRRSCCCHLLSFFVALSFEGKHN